MLRFYGPGLASDMIFHRYGSDGKEPGEVAALCDRYKGFGIRSTFAINTYYPEVVGGYFENRALFELIDIACRSLLLAPVNHDYWSNDVTCLHPLEAQGQLIAGEVYLWIDADELPQGLLHIWRCNGGGEYYSDNIIFDFILSQARMRQLVDMVEEQCVLNKVKFTRIASIESAGI